MLLHESLLEHIPKKNLMILEYECRLLRGTLWGKSTVNKHIFNHPPIAIFHYHVLVKNILGEVDNLWIWPEYRGKKIKKFTMEELYGTASKEFWKSINAKYHYTNGIVYPEHHDGYLKKSLQYLSAEGVVIADKELASKKDL